MNPLFLHQLESMDRDLVVTVLFDFEYHGSDGQRVYMHKDEEFLVIQQTNSDWWQVWYRGCMG